MLKHMNTLKESSIYTHYSTGGFKGDDGGSLGCSF